MLPDHSDAAFGFMLISTVSPLAFDDELRIYPHSARPQRSIRTDPLLPSVCQSPSGASAGSSSVSRKTWTGCGAAAGGGTAGVGLSADDVTGSGLGCNGFGCCALAG